MSDIEPAIWKAFENQKIILNTGKSSFDLDSKIYNELKPFLRNQKTFKRKIDELLKNKFQLKDEKQLQKYRHVFMVFFTSHQLDAIYDVQSKILQKMEMSKVQD